MMLSGAQRLLSARGGWGFSCLRDDHNLFVYAFEDGRDWMGRGRPTCSTC
jgi:hypothetical protein